MNCRARTLAAVLATVVPALAQDPAEFDRAYASAEQLRREPGEHEEVRAAYARASRAFLRLPLDSDAQRARRPAGAFSAHLAGDLGLAAELWEEALEIAPGDAFAVEWRLRAVLEVRGGEAALGEALARREGCEAGVRSFVVAARSLGAGALFEAAAARLRRGDEAGGLWPFEIAVADAGAAFDLANLALGLRFLGRLDQAVVLYQQALAAAPEDEVLWNDYGLCLKAAGREDEALRAFRSSIEHESAPGDGPGWTNLGLFARRGRQDALPDLVEGLCTVLRPRPDQQLCRYMLIDALMAGHGPPEPAGDDRGRAAR